MQQNYLALVVLVDSEISSVVEDQGNLRIRFAAARACHPNGKPFGYVRTVEVFARAALWHGNLSLSFGTVSAGLLLDGGVVLSSIPIPYQSMLPCVLELAFANGELLRVQADSVSILAIVPLQFTDSNECQVQDVVPSGAMPP